MRNLYLDQLTKDQEVVDFLLMTGIQLRKTKTEKPYLSLKLADKQAELDARVWDIPADVDPTELRDGMVVKVRAVATEWGGQLQLNVDRFRVALEGEYELGDLVRRSERDPQEMLEDLVDLIKLHMQSNNPLRQLLDLIILENQQDLLDAPAALSVHHAFVGGLLEHVLSMAKNSVGICKHYELRTDLVLAACVLHDVGKLRELSYGIATSYTTEGTLLGHISIGMMLVSDAIKKVEGFPDRLKMELLHLIASHHGMLAWGSPKVPLMREAIAFHYVDILDSKMGICAEALRADKSGKELTPYIKHLEGPLYRDLVNDETATSI